jgi:hypothetical protein
MHRRHNEQARDHNNKPDYRFHGITSLSNFPCRVTVPPPWFECQPDAPRITRPGSVSALSFGDEINARCLQLSRRPRTVPTRLHGMRIVRSMAESVRIESGRVLVDNVLIA